MVSKVALTSSSSHLIASDLVSLQDDLIFFLENMMRTVNCPPASEVLSSEQIQKLLVVVSATSAAHRPPFNASARMVNHWLRGVPTSPFPDAYDRAAGLAP